MSVTRFADAVSALLAAYQAAPALAGLPVYDGPFPAGAGDPDFVVVGHDATMGPDGTFTETSLTGTYLQAWAAQDIGQDETGFVNCVIVAQTGDTGDTAGRRARAQVLLAAVEDAAKNASPGPHLTFDGTSDGRWLTRQGEAGVAVIVAYRVAYSAPWG